MKGGDGVRSSLTTCRISQDRCVKEGGQHRPGRAHIKSRECVCFACASVHVSLCYRRGEFCRRSLGFAPAWLLLSVRTLLLEGGPWLDSVAAGQRLEKVTCRRAYIRLVEDPHPPAAWPSSASRSPQNADRLVHQRPKVGRFVCRLQATKSQVFLQAWGLGRDCHCITVSCRSCKSKR